MGELSNNMPHADWYSLNKNWSSVLLWVFIYYVFYIYLILMTPILVHFHEFNISSFDILPMNNT